MFSSKVPELPWLGAERRRALLCVPWWMLSCLLCCCQTAKGVPLFPAALLDALVVAVSEELGDQAVQRLSRLHQMKKNCRT